MESQVRRPRGPKFTGRQLVMLQRGATERALGTLRDRTGVKHIARSEDFGVAGMTPAQTAQADVIVFETLGVAVVRAEEAAVRILAAAPLDGVENAEPERFVYALEAGSGEYMRGYQDGIADGIAGLRARLARAPLRDGGQAERAAVEATATWGLGATRVVESRWNGTGIRVAVLDTGVDEAHPDFAGRNVVTQSFVVGETAHDGHGHGTHCIGTSCGPLNPRTPPRYGIAYGADIFAGKVLSNAGSGTDADILAGIDWAIRNRCEVVSMSLGAATEPGEKPSRAFERVGRRALRAGTLIVAAAGNESDRRNGVIAPVGHPANCRSFMAVAAVDSHLAVANFSCGGVNPDGGQVDIAAPGVGIRSSVPGGGYDTWDGTSMATPHVAGIAALFAQSDPTLRGAALWAVLIQHARRLPLPATDVGAGLVQAP